MGMSTDDQAALKKTRETISVILENLDKDLALQVVLSAVALNYQKVIEKATCCSDLMYCREMLASMKKQEQEKTATPEALEEIQDHLKRFGYLF